LNLQENKLVESNETFIYPNPAVNWLNIGNWPTKETGMITVTNLLGQTIFNQQLDCIENTPCSIYIGNLLTGCYTFVITTSKNLSKTGTFVKL